jgi:hypothetical protein
MEVPGLVDFSTFLFLAPSTGTSVIAKANKHVIGLVFPVCRITSAAQKSSFLRDSILQGSVKSSWNSLTFPVWRTVSSCLLDRVLLVISTCQIAEGVPCISEEAAL